MYAKNVLFTTVICLLGALVFSSAVNASQPKFEDVIISIDGTSSYAQVGNSKVMSVPKTEVTFRFQASVASASIVKGVDFNDSSGMIVSPPMAPGYELAPTFTVESIQGSSLIVALEEGKGVFLCSSPVATNGGTVIARARFRTNSQSVSIALGLLAGAWGDPDGSNQHVVYTSGAGFEDWKEVEVRFASNKASVTPFLQVAANKAMSDQAVGTSGVQVSGWVVYNDESNTPTQPTPTPVVVPTQPTPTPIVPTPTQGEYAVQNGVLIIRDWRNHLQQYTPEGSPEILGDPVGWSSGNRSAASEIGIDLHVNLATLNLAEGTNRLNGRVSQNNWLYSQTFDPPTGLNPLWHVTTSGFGQSNITMVIVRTGNVYSLAPAGTNIPTRG